MKGTRVFIPEIVEATGRYISVKTGLPLAEVYSVLLALSVEGVDPETLAGMVERKIREAGRVMDSIDPGKLPF